MLSSILSRLLFTHVLSVVSLTLVALLGWILTTQQFDVWATLLLGGILLEALIASGFLSGGMTLAFAILSTFVENGRPNRLSSAGRRRAQFIGFIAAAICISTEFGTVASRGHNTYALVATAMTLIGVYLYSLAIQSGVRAPTRNSER